MIPLHRLHAMLREHDWYFEFSDDHAVWTRGMADRAALARALSVLPEDEYVELIMQYGPKDPALLNIVEDTISETARCAGFRRQNEGEL
jgi:rhamnogalacturonyl hydrolase YesR